MREYRTLFVCFTRIDIIMDRERKRTKNGGHCVGLSDVTARCEYRQIDHFKGYWQCLDKAIAFMVPELLKISNKKVGVTFTFTEHTLQITS